MELLNSKEIKVKTGKTFLANEDISLIAKLIYLNGIEGFDNVLKSKNQVEIDAVIHLVKYKNGILIKLAQLFQSYETAISLSEIKSIQIESKNEYSFLQIEINSNSRIVFAFRSENKTDIETFFKESGIGIVEGKFVEKSPSTQPQLEKYIELLRTPKKTKINTILFLFTIGIGVIAFLIGYFIFAKDKSGYISINEIFKSDQIFEEIKIIRQNILITSFIGLAFGFLIGKITSSRK